MPDDLLDRSLDEAVGLPDLDAAWGRTTRRARQRRTARRAGAGLVTVVVVVGVLVGITGDDDGGGGGGEVGVATQPAGEQAPTAPGVWQQLPSVPTGGVVDPTLVATDGGVILWTDLVPGAPAPWDFTSGLTYDPARSEWTDLRQQRPSPGGGTWVGGELVDVPGTSSGPGSVVSRLTSIGAWEAFAETPGECANGRSSASERELYVVCTDGGAATTAIRALDVTADLPYEVDAPQSGAWRTLPPAPIPLVNTQLVWAGDRLLAVATSSAGSIAASYDPDDDRWELLPPPPLDEPNLRVAWTGSELLALDGAHAAAWSATTGEWRALPDVPQADGDGCIVYARAAAGRALAQTCHEVSVLDAEDRWQQADLPGEAAILSSTGGEDVLWAVADDGTFWSFTP